MEIEIKPLKPEELRFFLQLKDVAVIYVSDAIATTFNSALKNSLYLKYRKSNNIGFIDLNSCNNSENELSDLIGCGLDNLGIPHNNYLLPGYYLFKKGVLRAYHPGTFDISNLDQREKNFLGTFFGTFAAIAGLATGSLTASLKIIIAGVETATGHNILNFFSKILSANGTIDVKRMQRNLYETELDRAYILLGITKTASDQEIKTARNSKLKEYHPDKNTTDLEFCTKMTAQINSAYERICDYRKAFKDKFTETA